MNRQDAISEVDLGAERIPDYSCDQCGEDVPAPGLCDDCAMKLDDFLTNGQDPRR